MGHDPDDRDALRLFWEQLERVRPEAEAAVTARAEKIPALAALIASMDEETRRRQQVRGVELQRRAVLEGDWEPYLDDLRTQGRALAGMGVELRDWYALLGAYREVMWRATLPAGDARALGVLRGMEHHLDVAMSELGASYIAAKEDAVRQAEAELARYVDLFRQASLGMAIWRLEDPADLGSFRMLAANPAGARAAGEHLLGNVGKFLREINPTWAASEVPARWAAMLADHEPRDWSYTFRDESGARRTLAVRSFPLHERYLGVVFEDVTERERMTEQLERHVRELERSNRELDDFAYVTSHDLKSPLRDVRNLVSWIVEDAREHLPPASSRHLALLDDRVARMERLLDDLLEYSRVGRALEVAREFTLREVFDEVVALQLPPEGFTVTLESTAPPLFTPRAPLAKVLRNLVGNALKHHDHAAGSIVVRAALVGERVAIRVTDDGPGIPEEFHERVFRMFHTLRSRDEVEGSGVGLAIVKKTVELFGGAVHVESEGRGTTVAFTWPLRWVQPGDDRP